MFLIIAIFITVVYFWVETYLYIKYEDLNTTYTFSILFTFVILITLVLMLFAPISAPVINRVFSDYEKGKIVKEYKIIESDTTYRWVYKKS